MLWMSSCSSTVLPVPAPPKRPTLPPRTYGASRSTTLMPVSKISVVGESSSKFGGSRWIDQRSPLAASLSSTGSPSTFQMRPSVWSPTGTEIGRPVSVTSMPRASPSVLSIATARTRSSPRCCCTSATSWPPSRSIVTAWLISGSCPGKTASITTPLISTILPTFLPLLLMRLLGGGRGWSRRRRAPAERGQCIEALAQPVRGTGAASGRDVDLAVRCVLRERHQPLLEVRRLRGLRRGRLRDARRSERACDDRERGGDRRDHPPSAATADPPERDVHARGDLRCRPQLARRSADRRRVGSARHAAAQMPLQLRMLELRK